MNAVHTKGVKKYLSFLRIQFSGGLQYRAAAFGGLMTQFVWGFMYIMLYKAFYTADASAFPMSFEELTSYVWLQQAFLVMFFLWFYDNDVFNMIRNGDVAYELVRPLDLYNMWFTKHAANRLVKTFLRCFPIFILGFILPSPYGLSLPVDISTFLLFILTLILGFMVVCAFCMLIYIATFYTLNPIGVRMLASAVGELLTGQIVPLPFFPDDIRKVVELTPFASMQNLPFRIYSGDIKGNEIFYGILLQVFWIIILVFFGKLWMKKALKKVVVQGG